MCYLNLQVWSWDTIWKVINYNIIILSTLWVKSLLSKKLSTISKLQVKFMRPANVLKCDETHPNDTFWHLHRGITECDAGPGAHEAMGHLKTEPVWEVTFLIAEWKGKMSLTLTKAQP